MLFQTPPSSLNFEFVWERYAHFSSLCTIKEIHMVTVWEWSSRGELKEKIQALKDSCNIRGTFDKDSILMRYVGFYSVLFIHRIPIMGSNFYIHIEIEYIEVPNKIHDVLFLIHEL